MTTKFTVYPDNAPGPDGINPVGEMNFVELAQLELRESEGLLSPNDAAQRAQGDERHLNVERETRRVSDDARREQFLEDPLGAADALRAHLENLRQLERRGFPGPEGIDRLGVVEFLARDDHGKLWRRVAASVPNDEQARLLIPLDVEVDQPIFTLLAGCDTSNRIRFLADLVRRARYAIRFFGCNDSGLRSAVRLLRDALGENSHDQAAHGHEHARNSADGAPIDHHDSLRLGQPRSSNSDLAQPSVGEAPDAERLPLRAAGVGGVGRGQERMPTPPRETAKRGPRLLADAMVLLALRGKSFRDVEDLGAALDEILALEEETDTGR